MRRKYSSLRLKGFDYSRAAAYFVTLGVHYRRPVFGEVFDEEISLTPAGEIARDCWLDLPKHFSGLVLDEFIIMPDHLHGIIILPDYVPSEGILSIRRGAACGARLSLPTIMNGYKSAVSKRCHMVGIADFRWQRGYYDRIVRGEKELMQIRRYVQNNPVRWSLDRESG